jgi:hypothetical protein
MLKASEFIPEQILAENPRLLFIENAKRSDEKVVLRMKKIYEFIITLWNACPYTMLGKKTLHSIKGTAPAEHGSDIISKLEFQARIGWAIILIGFFCPFFWITLFSGVRGEMLYFNAAHSGFVMLFGLGYLLRIRYIRSKILKGKEQIKN